MILLPILFIIGSLMWVMPSPRQREIAALRKKAITAGFSVKFVAYEDYEALFNFELKGVQVPSTKQIVRYRLNRVLEEGEALQESEISNQQNFAIFSPEGALSEHSMFAGAFSEAVLLGFSSKMEGLLAIIWDESSLSLYYLELGDLKGFDFEDLKQQFLNA